MKLIIALLAVLSFSACSKLETLIPDALKTTTQQANNEKGLYVIHIHGEWCDTCKRIDEPIESLVPYFQKTPEVDYLVFDQTNPTTITDSLVIAKEHGLGNLFEHERHTGEVLFVDKASRKVLTRVYGVSRPEQYKEIIEKLLAGEKVPSILAYRKKYDLSKPPIEEARKAKLLVIDIHHDMCGSCAITAPIFERVARKYRHKKKICFMTFDLTTAQTVDETRNLARALGIEEIYNTHKHTGEVLFVNTKDKTVLATLVMETDKSKYHDLIEACVL